jgi:hypothetical protein
MADPARISGVLSAAFAGRRIRRSRNTQAPLPSGLSVDVGRSDACFYCLRFFRLGSDAVVAEESGDGRKLIAVAEIPDGSTRIQLVTLLAGLSVSLPTTFMAASYWGPVGAAAVWLAINIAFLLINVPMTLRRFLPGETASWLVRDVLLPIVVSVVIGGLIRIAYRETDSYLLMAFQVGIAFALVGVSCVFAADLVRGWIFRRSRFRPRPL